MKEPKKERNIQTSKQTHEQLETNNQSNQNKQFTSLHYSGN